jgi:hypothetical protein
MEICGEKNADCAVGLKYAVRVLVASIYKMHFLESNRTSILCIGWLLVRAYNNYCN